MHELYELKEKLMKELGEYSQNGKYSKEDVETIKYMASDVDHICNIVERAEGEEYSQRGSYANYSGNGGGGASYRGYSRDMSGNSYRWRGGNSYSRGRGQSAQRDSMGRYSGAAEPSELVDQIMGMMQDAPNGQIKQQMQQLVERLEQM